MKIGKTRLEVVDADITTLKVDCIVNPANDMLWLGGGVSAQLRKSGGDSIEQEALAKAPAKIGATVVTGAGTLEVKWVLHAVITGQDLVVTEPALRKAIRSTLDAAGSLRCGSVAIPMLIGEQSHFEVHIAATIIVEETVNFLVDDNRTLEYVAFVERDGDIRDIIEKTLLEKFTKHG